MIGQSLRHAARRLLSTPAFSSAAVLTVGVAIGANALIFSVVNGVLLKPLPFADPDRLVGVWHLAPGVMPGPLNQSPATYFTYRDEARVFEDIGMWDGTSATVTGRGEPERVEALLVTDGTLPLLGVRPAAGRFFTPADAAPGAARTVVLSHAYWMRAFGGNPSAVGQVLTVNSASHEIIGVLPEGFRFLRQRPALVLPFQFDRNEIFLGQFSYQGVARLEPGVTIEQANADLDRLIPTLMDRYPLPPGLDRSMFEHLRLSALVRPLSEDVVGDVGKVLWVLLGTVGIVLLVACANVANLFLVRAEGRQRELAIRAALGAGRAGIARELLSESLLIGLTGGALGLALAYAGVRLLVVLEPAELPRLDEIAIDPLVMAFTLGLSGVAGLLFGVIPIIKYARPRFGAALKEGGRGSSEGRERHRARNGLVIAQVGLALVLLLASALMVRTFVAMRHVQPGFARPGEVLTVRISIPEALIEDPVRVAGTFEEIQQRLLAVPGVSAVGLSSSLTLDGWTSNDPVFVEDFPSADGQLPILRRYRWVGEGSFAAMGNPILAGRDVTWRDIHARTPVVLVSENLAREFWGDPAAALGRRIRNSPGNRWREIVGVVGNERDDGVNKPAPTLVYFPLLIEDFWDEELFALRTMAFAIRTPRVQAPGFLKEVQQAVWAVNPNLPLSRVETLQEIYDESMAQTSFALVILGISAGVALLLGVVGIYGVIAYIVSQRTREVGIRMALGARGGDVERLFVRRGLLLTGAGLALGLVASLGVMRLLSSLLYGVTAFDPVAYTAVMGGLGTVGLLATWLPARRATRIDPASALRAD